MDHSGTPPTWGAITPRRPLIVLQTNNRFGDSDEFRGGGADPLDEAARHGREAVRVWREAIPDELRPLCHMQMEVRVRDHRARLDRFRRLFDEMQAAGTPANFQFADPHDQFVFEPECVETLLLEYPCIQSMTITEINFEHYRSFNVPRYAVSPEARYAMDIIDLAVKHGKYLSVSLQGVKWMHVAADVLNRPLFNKIVRHGGYVLPVNEHIGPQHLPRQTSVWGLWMAGLTRHWGVEPQSWWFENGRMISPGLFGQFQADNTRNMPAAMYRAMILQGALLGATVYQFEPFWDLFDYDNAACWREVIAPTLLEVVRDGLISSREQCLEKTPVAYQYKEARDINEFHENLRDVDWIHDEGLLARAAYGLWDKFMEHELIPNKSRYFFLPLLPPATPPEALARFAQVIQPGECASEAEYGALLDRHHPPQDTGTAWVAGINGHTYVMQSHENLYERQTYRVSLPRRVRGITGALTGGGLRLEWPPVEAAAAYHVMRVEGETLGLLGKSAETSIYLPRPEGESVFTVLAETSARETVTGTVNYLDYLVFSETVSLPAERVCVDANGAVRTEPWPEPEDTRPASQVVYPTFEGAEEHLGEAAELAERIDAFKQTYEAADWRGMLAFYAEDYGDSNGYHREYAGRAWKWWFFRNNTFCFLRQIRWWDFSRFAEDGTVRVRLFALCRTLRRDDTPFGSQYDGTLRIPRTADEEVTFTWRRDGAGAWVITHTDPALPNFEEMLWNSRGADKTRLKLVPGKDGDPECLPEGQTNLLPMETNWLPPEWS